MSATLRRRALIVVSLCLPVAFLTGPAAAQSVSGSGQMQTEMRPVTGFTAVQLEASMTVEIRQSGTEAVQVRADDNLLPLIETFVESRGSESVLVVRWKRWTNVRHSSRIEVTVDAVRVDALSTSGSGAITAGALKADRLRLSVAGSGDIRVQDLAAGELVASVAGSGDIRVGGRAASAKLSIAGSGDADLSGLSADDVKVSIAGSGDASVSADQSLSVSIAGSGDVRYSGRVTEVKTSVVGSGDVRRR
jgi:hypothetical protein